MRTAVVYNGADTTLFTTGPEPQSPLLLSVGNLIATKGHRLVVEALVLLSPEFPGLSWEIIGDGPEAEPLRELAAKLGVLESIRFRGRLGRVEVAEACRRSTVFVLPSSTEGLGCVYLEAMASGKPAIGCSGQGIEEVIRQGENGWLVPPEGQQELTEGLRILLRDESRRKQIGLAARETILRSYTVRQQAERLAALYREILA